MADIAASVLTRLKNKAQASGRSYQLCLQLFCQEEFLRSSKNQNTQKILFSKADCLSIRLPNLTAELQSMLIFCFDKCRTLLNNCELCLKKLSPAPTENEFVTFEITDVAPIAVAKKYAGIGASLVAHIKNTRTPFSIDFGVGDVIVPKQEKRKIPTQLDDFASPTVNTYSLETIIAEKLDAILDLMEFSSRMKDYYDIYYLANKFDFDGATLTKALKKTFENRAHAFTMEQFEQVMAFAENDAMQKKWKAFCRKIDTKTDDFNTVLKTIKEFLIEPFTAAVENKEFEEKWTAADGRWRR